MHQNNFEEKMSKFYDNIDKKFPNSKLPARCRSVYFIQKEDRDGNVIDEKYGINHMTDEGMVLLTHGQPSGHYANYSNSLIVKPEGYDEFSLSRNEVESSMKTDGYNKYDKTTGFFYRTYEMGKYVITYDYEAQNISDKASSMDFDINQLAIAGNTSTSSTYPYNISNGYFSLSDIYDIDGNPVSLTKNAHEKLTIYYYVSAGYRPDTLMPSLWNKGIYSYISPTQLNFAANSYMPALCLNEAYISYMSGGNIRFGGTHGLSYDRYIWSTYEIYRHKNGSAHPSDHSLMSMKPTINNHTITSRDGTSQEEIDAVDAALHGDPILTDALALSATKIIDETTDKGAAPYAFSMMSSYNRYSTYSSYNSYHLVRTSFYASKENLDDFETVESDNIYTNNFKSQSLSYNFGYVAKIRNPYVGGYLPVYDIDIESLTMYNVKTNKWDIDVNTNNETAKNNYYAEFPVFGDLSIKGQIVSGITSSIDAYLFINIQPNVDIKSFTGDLSSRIVYGTDKYWDMSSWELIQNNSDIQQSARNYKYYIFTGGTSIDDYYGTSNSLYVNRDRISHSIVLPRYNYTLPIQWKNDTTDYVWYAYRSDWDNNSNYANYGFSSYENHWFVANNSLYYVDPTKDETTDPTAYKIFKLYGPNNTPALMTISYRYDGKYIMIPGRWKFSNDPDLSTTKMSVRIYHSLDNLTSSTTDLSYCDILLELEDEPGTLTFNYNKMDIWFSESKSGYVIASYDSETSPVSVAFNFNDLDTTDNTIQQIRLPENAYHPIAIKMTSYVAFIDKNDMTKVHIWDIATQDYIAMNIFIAPENETILFILGWKSNIYITTRNTATSSYNTYYYNIESTQSYQIRSNTSEMFNNMLIQRNTIIRSSDTSFYKNPDYVRAFDNIEEFCNDNCYVLYPRNGTANTGSYTDQTLDYFSGIYFTESEPDKVHFITSKSSKLFDYPYMAMYGTIDSVNDDKQLVLPILTRGDSSNSYIRPTALDIGRIVGTHTSAYIPYESEGYKNYDYVVDDRFSYMFTGKYRTNVNDGKIDVVQYDSLEKGAAFMWGNGVMCFLPDKITSVTDKTTATNRIDWYPVEQLLPMRIKGKTKTIQFANNPKRIGKKNFSITITNSQ